MPPSSDSGSPGPDLRFLFLSPASRQALLGMRALALPETRRFSLAEDAAKAAGLPAGSLAKVFQRLARRGLLLAQRGPGGGYALARPAETIPLSEILKAVQDIIPGGRQCMLANRLCGEKDTFCPIHSVIIEADALVIDGFSRMTLRDLVDGKGWA